MENFYVYISCRGTSGQRFCGRSLLLAEIDGMIPAQAGKDKRVILFSLIEGYLDNELSYLEFLKGLKVLLGATT